MGHVILVARLAVRDLRGHIAQALMLMIAVAVASTTLTLGLLLHGETNHPYNRTRAATRGPDVVASVFPPPGAPVTHSQLETLTALNHAGGVTGHSGPFPVTWTTLRRGSHAIGAELEGRDVTSAAVDQPKVISGTWLRPGGVVVERAFAQALDVHVGDNIHLGATRLHIVGIAVTAAFSPYPKLCTDGCALTTPELANSTPGLIWVTRDVARHQATGGRLLTYFDNLRLSDSAAAAAFAARHGNMSSVTAPSMTTWQEIFTQDADLIHDERTVMIVGSWLLAALAVATTMVLVGTRLSDQTRRVGLLKAVGGTPSLISAILLAEFLTVTVVASLVGLVAGRVVAAALTAPGAGLLGAADAPSLTVSAAALVVGVALVLTVLATAVPAFRAVRTSTLRALRDPARPPRRVAPLIDLSTRLPVPVMLGLRLAVRRPRRVVLSALAVAVAVTGIVVILFARVNLTVHEQNVAGLTDPRNERLGQLMLALSLSLALMATVNLVFTTVSTAVDARGTLAVVRARRLAQRRRDRGLPGPTRTGRHRRRGRDPAGCRRVLGPQQLIHDRCATVVAAGGPGPTYGGGGFRTHSVSGVHRRDATDRRRPAGRRQLSPPAISRSA